MAAGAGLVVVALLAVFSSHAGPGWEAGSIAGLLATIGALALSAFPVRPRESTPPAPTPLSRHRDIGYAVLGLSVIHVVVLAVVDPPMVAYLHLTMPLYQWAGIVALLMLMALCVTSSATARRRLWHSHRGFQALHVVGSIVAIILITVHIVASDRYVFGRPAAVAYVGISIGCLWMLLRARKGARGAVAMHGLAGRAAFGRHSLLVLVTTLLASAAIGALLDARLDVALRASPIRRTTQLPMTFPHEKHVTVNCVDCHHNYVDKLGFTPCIRCHRSDRTDLKVAIEPRFHTFCFQCHRDKARTSAKHGPVAGCMACHRGTSKPLT